MRKNISFILLFLLLNLFLFSIIKYSKSQNNINFIHNHLLTKNAVEIIDNDLSKYESSSNSKIRVFLEINDKARIVIKNDKWTPSMKSGEFLNLSEKGNKVVIGDEYLEYSYKERGKKYIDILNEKFEIIGILGEKFKSKSDSLMLLTMNKIPTIKGSVKVIVDGQSKRDIDKYINNLNIKDSSIIKKNKSFSIGVVNPTFFYNLILITSILLSAVSVITFIIYYIINKLKLVKVQYLLGLTKYLIIKESLLDICIKVTIAYIISLICIAIFKLDIDILDSLKIFIVQLMLSMLTGFISLHIWFNKSGYKDGGFSA